MAIVWLLLAEYQRSPHRRMENIMQIGKGKQGVLIGEYAVPETIGEKQDTNPILGWIEPAADNPQWILWFMADGSAVLYRGRDENGGILHDPLKIYP
jgi:hypothetical protein